MEIQLCLPLGEWGSSSSSKSTFNLEKAVCNHGFFMMAPNQWIPSAKTLQRPLRLADSTTSVLVSISHPKKHPSDLLHIHVLGTNFLSPQDQQVLLAQVARMLRISEKDENKILKFHEIHSRAKKKGFGRLFRSPSLFEDMVKSILLCNCNWKRSLDMAKALCDLQLQLSGGSVDEESICSSKKMRTGRRGLKRKNRMMVSYDPSPPSFFEERIRAYGNFPTSKDLANLDVELLEKHCNLGYRASYILQLAKQIETGGIKLLEKQDEEDEDKDYYDNLYKKLKRLNGFGSFVCDNMLMCLGLYERIPTDTETLRHLGKVKFINAVPWKQRLH
ncbi:uncharacterized protein LOC122647267 [Telopea speciosissima]|uniref:uncharacterized protein LOC122647267 n=1 Tax=Telopea speciosissima TaxID=54955 RepID=UPI001CC48A7E|nr:uncharacterized protein LOC122647267 [Telopea speciosissima]